jgi:hypothetical protein
MKKTYKIFFIKLALLVTPFIAILTYIELTLRSFPTAMSVKKKAFDTHLQQKNTQILILGTSHTLTSLNPEKLTFPSFNLAESGQPFYYDYHLLNKYIDRLPKLKVAIIDISYFSLTYNFMDDKVKASRREEYFHVWGIESPNVKWFYPKAVSQLLSTGTYSSLTLVWTPPQLDPKLIPKENGWRKNDTTIVEQLTDNAAKEQLKEINKLMTFDSRTVAQNIELLENLITTLQSHNVTTVCITTPLHTNYVKNINHTIDAFNKVKIKEIEKKYVLQYFDYSEDKRFVDTDFVNLDHLNTQGANKFSEIIRKEVLVNIIK